MVLQSLLLIAGQEVGGRSNSAAEPVAHRLPRLGEASEPGAESAGL